MAKIILDEAPKSIEECPFRQIFSTGWKCHFIMKCVLEEGKSFDKCPACTISKTIKEWYDGTKYDTIIKSDETIGYRGKYYLYALLLNNEIVAFGEEEGNYSGDITAKNKDDIQRKFENLSLLSDIHSKSLYEKLIELKVKI